MNHLSHPARRAAQRIALTTLTLAVLAACGGGSDATDPNAAGTTTPTPPPPVTVAGKVVIDQSIRDATVCIDLNANNACDSSEPTAAATGADGSYSLTYDSAKITVEQLAKAALIALIPASTAVDAANPTVGVTAKSYVLSTPAGKPGQVNPLTTLVQTGMASGLTLAEATAAVALQMGITEAEIFDYQASPATTAPNSFSDTARLMAKVTASALEASSPLAVLGVAAPTDPVVQQAQFNFTDLDNHYIRNLTATDLKGTGLTQVTDTRSQKAKGVEVPQTTLFQTAYLAKSGWVHCDAVGFQSTRGNPSRSAYCGGGQNSAGFTVETDLSGKSMGDTLRTMQAATNGSNTVNMDPTLVDGKTFPSGSTLRVRSSVNLGDVIYVNNLNSTNEIWSGANYANLETFIKARQKANVKLAPQANTGLTWLGLTEDTNHWLAGAFSDETSGVQYYSCTFNATTNNFDTCAEAGTGTFSVVTQNGVRLIKFAGQPKPVDTINYTVGYGEYAPNVMARYRISKPSSTYAVTQSQRLNGTAGDALRKAVGL